jgi:hypothetical protein
MAITDLGMLTYWSVTALVGLDIVQIPTEYLFKDYNNPRVIAWNWSFLPLDLLLSLSGLLALHLERRNDRRWVAVAIISLVLTHCAGLMAIAYWAILGEISWSWWLPNLFLMLWPLPFLFHLISAQKA